MVNIAAPLPVPSGALAIPQTDYQFLGIAVVVADWLIRVLLTVRIIARRQDVSKALAWLALVLAAPMLGLFIYLLVGESRLGTLRVRRYKRIWRDLGRAVTQAWITRKSVRPVQTHGAINIARVAEAVGQFPAVADNLVELYGDADRMLDRLIEDIDAARHHCHFEYYIWAKAGRSNLVAEAVMRAAARGVQCRILVDAVGSSDFLGVELVERLTAAGVKLVEALPVGRIRSLFNRIDLRNHRKIAVIDGRIGYAGSQNLNDSTFGVPRKLNKLGPWFDATLRIEGPAVSALQSVFMCDWKLDAEEAFADLAAYFPELEGVEDGAAVHVIASGPGGAGPTVHNLFLEFIASAREELVMTTPYLVPDDATLIALENAVLRGVHVTLIVPEKHDHPIVLAAAQGHYSWFLDKGIEIHAHRGGLLHAKTATIDRRVAIVGSANIDIRSFWLNFELTLCVYDARCARQVRDLQDQYLSQSRKLSPEQWRSRAIWKRAVQNTARLLSPLL